MNEGYFEHRKEQMEAVREDFARHWDRWVQNYVSLRGYFSSDERTLNAVKHVAWQAFMAGISTHNLVGC